MLKKIKLLFILLVSVSIINPFQAKAFSNSTISLEKLVETINSSVINDKLLTIFKSNESDSVSLNAIKTDSGVTLTYTINGQNQVFNYTYEPTVNVLAYEVAKDDPEVIGKLMIGSFMQFWLYEASQYADKEYLKENFSTSNSSSGSSSEGQTNNTTCDISENGFCIADDDANNKILYTFLLNDTFAIKFNEAIDQLSKVPSTIEARDITTSSVNLYANTPGYLNEDKICYIYKSSEENGNYEIIPSTGVACDGQHPFYIDTLTPGQTYYFKAIYSGSKVFSDPIKVTLPLEEAKKYKNPETGAFANYMFILLVLSTAITSVMVLRRKYKFYRI